MLHSQQTNATRCEVRPFGMSLWLATALFLGLHAALALVMRSNASISTAHALTTAAAGVWFAYRGGAAKVAYICAYITGAEVLWRMTHAAVFWEFGKYSIVLILAVAIIRLNRPVHFLAVGYFALLLPSAALTVTAMNSSAAQQALSFNLSGPLAIMLCVWFFSGLQPREVIPYRVLIAALAPICGIAASTIYATTTAVSLEFGRNSNFITSDGFGPNQVSAALGTGAFLCFFFIAAARIGGPFRLLLLGTLFVCSIQSALTFSRGGLYMAAGAAACGMFYLLRDAAARKLISVGVPLVLAITTLLVLPNLDRFTSGALSRRFTNTGLTNRDAFIAEETRIWAENPVFGVGPGMSRNFRNNAAAHTEVTRMLAEHGLWGAASLLLLLGICARNVMNAQSILGKAFSLSLVVCALLFMLTAALRTVEPALLIGLSAIPFNNRQFGTSLPGRLFRYRAAGFLPENRPVAA